MDLCDCGGLVNKAEDNCSLCQANGLEYEEGHFGSVRNKRRHFSTSSESRLDQFLEFLETNAKYMEDRNQDRVVGMYKFQCDIGCGGFSTVKLATHIFTKEQVAIKIIDKSQFPGELEKILGQEVRCMEVLNHPNLIRLYEVIESVSKIHLVTEWAPVGDLYLKIKSNGKMTEPDAKLVFRQIVDGILYMHDNGIFHRDIKAENVLFSTATVCKICDFGFSTVGENENLLTTFCGSPAYSAPELYRNIQYERGPADAWSLGILLFYLTEGHHPFKGKSLAILRKQILNGNYKLSKNSSKGLVDLIQKILKQKPMERFTVAQIKNHSWLSSLHQEIGVVKLLSINSYNTFNAFEILGIQKSIMSKLGSVHDPINCQSNGCCKGELTPNFLKTVNCRLIPTKEQIMYRLVSQEEIKAYEVLLEIGVSESTIRAHKSRGMRSYVIGIYRIILHKIQKGEKFDVTKFGLPCDLSNSLMNLKTCVTMEGIEEVESQSGNDKGKCTDSSKLGEMEKEADKSRGSGELTQPLTAVKSLKKRILAKSEHVVRAKVCAIL